MSSFLHERLESNFSRHLARSEYALEYHLSGIIPKGSIICALFPKKLLSKFLPIVAKEKNARVIAIGNKEIIPSLIKAGVLFEGKASPDIFIGEPAGFSKEGIFVAPEETQDWLKNDVLAMCSALQWSSISPAKLDSIPAQKIVSELGVFPHELFVSEVSKRFSGFVKQ